MISMDRGLMKTVYAKQQFLIQMIVFLLLGLAFFPMGIAYPHIGNGTMTLVNGSFIMDNMTAATTTMDCIVTANVFTFNGNIAFAGAKHSRSNAATSTASLKSKPVRTRTNELTTVIDGGPTKTSTFGPTATGSSTGPFTSPPTTRSSFSKPYFTGTPSEFLTSTVWTTPSAPPCTDGPQPSTTATVGFDDVSVTWWYALLPTHYANMHLRNTFVMDSRIVDADWEDLSQSKPNFGVHPGLISKNATMRGAFDESGFFSTPDGGTFDVVSFWVQCERICELRVFETGFDWVETELLADPRSTKISLPLLVNEAGRLILDGGVGYDGMVFIDVERIYGWGAGRKVRWLRYWARDLRDEVHWNSPAGEMAISVDDLIIVRRAQGPGCAEEKPTRDPFAEVEPETQYLPTSSRRRTPQYGVRFGGNLRF